MKRHRVTIPHRARKYHIYNVGKSWLWFCYCCGTHMRGFHHPNGREAYWHWLWHYKNRCPKDAP